ncbi:uncharacterized protein Z519_01666 [Cladophialophora bantiana CBS 173.52]|uniref:Queuosine 5'-phosphate N-glycosylase/hydrolase n=1 Tax=Cladophialophora bantiana (strain ATCC 10958 / CBS 173.52 / CDC B-1940 / NIH 8579) TaxID=1442370 RepID=A0A0D2GI97_CLAB1|nr:uncharacterized protein Z519_01666 [Cladophialophora bantiana CBS 173.52]KIW98082.1 hypothetical protein Z519_01666 [Cladophialophora bantiana CBS 173.52]
MSDDEADPELLALLRQSLGLGGHEHATAPPSTGVLESAEYIYDNAIDVAISSTGTKKAAEHIYRLMQSKGYSTGTWSTHELHPKLSETGEEETVNFIFTMNLLNFSFWSELPESERFAVEYRGRRWTGYWSLIAALQRALNEGYTITNPHFWQDRDACPDSVFEHIFRSATHEPIPLLKERIAILREAGSILYEHFGCKPANIIRRANGSAPVLVNILVEYFPNFRDVACFQEREVRLYKRAQILVADLWACFQGTSYGAFSDIDSLTMFADYRIPQMLQGLQCVMYSPRLESRISRQEMLKAGAEMEIEIRGCSIWCVELIKKEILRKHPEAKGKVNAILIDFFLYDTCKEMEKGGEIEELLPHHRTRSIFY